MPQSRPSPVVLLAVGAIALAVGLLAVAGFPPFDRSDDPVANPSSRPSIAASPLAPSVRPATSAPTASPSDARPVAVGRGTPACNGPCKVENRLTRSFLPRYSGRQTLLLASSTEPDDAGNFLHAFLVDDAGRVIWQEHGFGWQFRRVDEKFAIRFDDAGHVFFRAYVADATYLYVLHTTGAQPRLVGAPGREGTDGFSDAELVERPGEKAFRIREWVLDCPEGSEEPPETCPTVKRMFRWDGTQYVEA